MDNEQMEEGLRLDPHLIQFQDEPNSVREQSEAQIAAANWGTHPLLVAVQESLGEEFIEALEGITEEEVASEGDNSHLLLESIESDDSIETQNMEISTYTLKPQMNEEKADNLNRRDPLLSLIGFGNDLNRIKKETRKLIWNQKVRTKTVDTWLGFSPEDTTEGEVTETLSGTKVEMATETPKAATLKTETPDNAHISSEDETSDYGSGNSYNVNQPNVSMPSELKFIQSINVVLKAVDDDEDDQIPKYKRFSESIVEREIRLAREREEALQRDRMIALATMSGNISLEHNPSVITANVTQIDLVKQKDTSVTVPTYLRNVNDDEPFGRRDTSGPNAPLEDVDLACSIEDGPENIPVESKVVGNSYSKLSTTDLPSYYPTLTTQKDSQRRMASLRLKQEIEEQLKREWELREEGSILTTSEETIDDKAAQICEAVRADFIVEGSNAGFTSLRVGQDRGLETVNPIYSALFSSLPMSPKVTTFTSGIPSPPASACSTTSVISAEGEDVMPAKNTIFDTAARWDTYSTNSNRRSQGPNAAANQGIKGAMSKFIASGGRLVTVSPTFSKATRGKEDAASSKIGQSSENTFIPPKTLELYHAVPYLDKTSELHNKTSSSEDDRKLRYEARWLPLSDSHSPATSMSVKVPRSGSASVVQRKIDEEIRQMKLRETELKSFQARNKWLTESNEDVGLTKATAVKENTKDDKISIPSYGKPTALIAQWEEMIQQSSEC